MKVLTAKRWVSGRAGTKTALQLMDQGSLQGIKLPSTENQPVYVFRLREQIGNCADHLNTSYQPAQKTGVDLKYFHLQRHS